MFILFALGMLLFAGTGLAFVLPLCILSSFSLAHNARLDTRLCCIDVGNKGFLLFVSQSTVANKTTCIVPVVHVCTENMHRIKAQYALVLCHVDFWRFWRKDGSKVPFAQLACITCSLRCHICAERHKNSR